MATIHGASITITPVDEILVTRLREFVTNGGDTSPLMARLGEHFAASTQERFTTQTDPGGIPWKPLSQGYIKRKKKNQSLVLTLNGYLRRYIAPQVLSPSEVAWGSNRIYAAIHNMGGNGAGRNGSMPKRQFLGVSQQDNVEALAIVQDWLHRKLNGLPD